MAGTFYPADATQCRSLAGSYLRPNDDALREGARWVGGIVPHAGWICSGAIAGQTIATLAAQGPVDVVVVFGAIHTPQRTDVAALDGHGAWSVPGGQTPLAQQLERALVEDGRWFTVDERFHAREHAVEVELPLIQQAFEHAILLPVEVPVGEQAVEIGKQTAARVSAAGMRAVYLASSDLTHYGPDYEFAPAGIGEQGLHWAKENDQRLLRLVTDMQVEQVVPEVRVHWNACGGGAIAAMLAAARHMGATRGRVLTHANSFQTLAEVAPQPPVNAVGYASVVVG